MSNGPQWQGNKPGNVDPTLDPARLESGTEVAMVSFNIFGNTYYQNVDAPRGPSRPRDILPAVRLLEKTIVAQSIRRVEAQGKRVSCQAGCGVCCCQLVPIARTEAYALRALVESMLEPRRTEICRRFAAARNTLKASALWDQIRRASLLPPKEHEAIALAYFNFGIKCPFLEEGSCSIYKDRPLVCREYLVTSPAEACAAPTRETVEKVQMPGALWKQFVNIEKASPHTPEPWIIMTLALEWAESHAEQLAERTGQELISALLGGGLERSKGKKPHSRKKVHNT